MEKAGMKKVGISNGLRYFYGSCDFIAMMSVSFKTYYWTYFLTTVIALPLAATGIMNTAINVFDLIMAFLWGGIMDKMKVGRWGKYRTIMIVCGPLIFLTHIAQWFGPTLYAFGSSVTVAVLVGFIAFAIYIVVFNLAWIAATAIPTFTCANEKERSTIIGTKTIWSGLTGLTVSYVAAWMLSWFKDPVIGYAGTASIMGIGYIIGYYINFMLIKDYEWTPAELIAKGIDPNEKKEGGPRVTLLDTFKVLISNNQLLITTLIGTFNTLASFLWSYMGVYLFEMTLSAEALYAFYITITNFAGISGAFVSNLLTSKVASKTLCQIGFGTVVVCQILARFATASLNATLFTILMVISRFALAIAAPSLGTFYTNCSIYEEWKTGVNRTAIVMSCPNVATKISLTAIGIIVPAVLASTGYVAGAEVTQATKTALANWYNIVPAIVYGLSLITITFGYKLDRKTVDGYLKDIQERATVKAAE